MQDGGFRLLPSFDRLLVGSDREVLENRGFGDQITKCVWELTLYLGTGFKLRAGGAAWRS